ncbi:MAG: tetratricopeptide repeat protein, partial [Pyrinomonadaceae bacterium]
MFRRSRPHIASCFPGKVTRTAFLLFAVLLPPAPYVSPGGEAAGAPAPSLQQVQTGAGSDGAREATVLEPGEAVERELAGGQTHSYQMRLAQGQHAVVSLDQRGIDVVVELLGTDNGLIAAFDGEIRSQGKEEIEAVAETTGTYTLSVRAKLKGVPAGSYEIRFAETRAATDDDRSLQEARKLHAQFARLQRVGRYDEARPLIERALAIAERVLGAEHVYVARLVGELGDNYYAGVDHAKAKPLYERALAILEKGLGAEHPRTAHAAHRLGVAYFIENDVAGADKLFNRALEVREKQLGPEHPQVALSLHDLGLLYDGRGDRAKAEQFLQRALAIAEKNPGTEDALLATALNSLGAHYLEKSDNERAEQFLQRSLAVREKLYGPEHFNLADVLHNLG